MLRRGGFRAEPKTGAFMNGPGVKAGAKPTRAISQSLVLIGLPALVAMGLLAYSALTVAPELAENQKLVSHTLEVIAAARGFDLAVGDAESAERGFIITADNAYLATYQKNTAAIGERIAKLRTLTADNPDQQRRVALIESAIEGRFAEMQEGIAARRNQGFIDARRIIESRLGTDTRQVISGLVDGLIAHENGLLAQRQASLAATQNTVAALDKAAIGLVLALLLFGVFLLVRAVARERRSIAHLRESEERFRLLVSGVRDYAIVMLDAQGRVASWNLGAERIEGYRPHDILGLEYSVFFPPEDREKGVPGGQLGEAAEHGSFETEGWHLRKDGSRYYANVSLTALRAENGNLRGFARITRDVTERRAQERALEDSRAALVQAQKMESLGQLTGGIAHDFNNLLTVIIGSVDLVLRRGVDNERSREFLEAARKAGEQGASLVRRLLAFARRQTLAPQSVDVNRLVSSMTELIRRTLGESVVVETVLGANVWRTRVDPNQLESALLNLAVNARDAMPEHGRLTIETGNTFLDDEYAAAHTEVVPGEYIVVAVSDTGSGMSEQTRERAFEPFFTTKAEGKGTGLGLSQVHGFVKQSGGHVALTSESGHGTTVYMYLPRASATEAAEAADAPKLQAAPVESDTVLLVEDEPLVRMYGNEVLTDLGYNVLEAGDGNEALRVLAEHPEIGIMFTDVGLPGGLNGKRLAEEARARVPSLKVLFATGYARMAVLDKSVDDPATELLEKPYTADALAQKLKRLTAGEGAPP